MPRDLKPHDRNIAKKVYEDLATTVFDQNRLPFPRLSREFYALQLARLESFVEDLQKDDAIPFLPCVASDGKSRDFHMSALASAYFPKTPDFISIASILSPAYDYNEHINVFVECCQSLGLLGHRFDWKNKTFAAPRHRNTEFDGMSAEDTFNSLVAKLRQACRTQLISAKISARRREADARFQDYANYVNRWFAECSRLVVIRLDLFYKAPYATEWTAQAAVEDLNRLISNRRHNALFEHMKGYIAKLEYGVEKGLHFHLILFFDGNFRQGTSHVHLAQSIGEYWCQVITQGKGDYWNCNAKYKEFKHLGIIGIGDIHYSDTKLRNNLINRVLLYMCKSSQFLKPKAARGFRTMRRGASPKPRPTKRGRSRIHS